MAKKQSEEKSRKGVPRNATPEVVIPSTSKGKTCPGIRKKCNYLGKKDACSINGARCNC